MKRFIFVALALLLAVGCAAKEASASDTNFSGVKIDGDATGNTTSTTVFTVTDTSGSNTVTIDGDGDTAYLETGGSRGSADFEVDGYTQLDGGIDASSSPYLMIPVGVSSDLTTCSSTIEGAVHVVTNARTTATCDNAGGGVGTEMNICICDGNSWKVWSVSTPLVA